MLRAAAAAALLLGAAAAFVDLDSMRAELKSACDAGRCRSHSSVAAQRPCQALQTRAAARRELRRTSDAPSRRPQLPASME